MTLSTINVCRSENCQVQSTQVSSTQILLTIRRSCYSTTIARYYSETSETFPPPPFLFDQRWDEIALAPTASASAIRSLRRASRHKERQESSQTVQKIRIDWSVGANGRFDKLQSTPFNASRGSFSSVGFTTNSRCNSRRRQTRHGVSSGLTGGKNEGEETRGARWLMRFDTVIAIRLRASELLLFLDTPRDIDVLHVVYVTSVVGSAWLSMTLQPRIFLKIYF